MIVRLSRLLDRRAPAVARVLRPVWRRVVRGGRPPDYCVVSEHASLEECREHADRMNQIIADALARSAQRGEHSAVFQNPFLCMPQGHVPRPRRQ
jgi:hypothetical protein